MISLPSLMFYLGNEDLCLTVLKNFAKHEVQGLLPNHLGLTKDKNAYNAVDVSLWLAWAVQQHCLSVKNPKICILHFWQTLKNIFDHYRLGTLYNIKMQENGLIYAGNVQENLTWMDAVIDGLPVTPRYGYQVEVNALWFNFLNFMLELAIYAKDDSLSKDLQRLISLVQRSFSLNIS